MVADTVAAPIEQQVNGIDHMLYMSSQSGNDGSYTLTVTFDIGTDTNTALVMVQNRVQLAMQLLPTSVQNQGILIRKKTPDILMVVNFFSPQGLHDDVYLSNYATINVKDELLRIEGVSDITYLGERDYSIRAWLDPQKLASLNLNASDVANAVLSQNLDAPAGQVGQPPASRKQSVQLPIDTLGRLTEPEQFGDIIIKSVPGQQPPSNSVSAPTSTSTNGLPNPIGTNALPPPGSTTTPPSSGTSPTGTALAASMSGTAGAGGIASPVPPIMVPGAGGGTIGAGVGTSGPLGKTGAVLPTGSGVSTGGPTIAGAPRAAAAARRSAAPRVAAARRLPAVPQPAWRATSCLPTRPPA